MTGFTPNYAIPYAQPTDPADVPFYLEGLAVQVDEVLADLELQARARPMAQFLGTIPNTLPGTATLGTLTWQLTDFNTPGPIAGVPAVVPINDASTTALQVNYAGFWYIFGTVQAQNTVPAANIDSLGTEILHNGIATPANSRSNTHDTTNSFDPTVIIDASCGIFLNAGDTVGLRGLVDRASGAASATFGRRSITMLRMTQS
jgi:hypothetical protein